MKTNKKIAYWAYLSHQIKIIHKAYWLTLIVLCSAIFLGFYSIKTYMLDGQRLQDPKVLGATTEKARGNTSPQPLFIPKRKNTQEIPIKDISARGFAVIDENSKLVLLDKQPHLTMPIASLTKLMTALLAYQYLDPEKYLQISQSDILKIQPNLGLKLKDKIKILDLLEATLVCSANDAAKSLANAVEKIQNVDFEQLMNKKALELEMFETNFSNPMGFDSNSNYSSVNDLAKLVFYTQNFALFKNSGRRTEATFYSESGESFFCKATNKLLLKNLEIESIKTGYTEKAKGSIISRVRKDNASLIIIVIGSDKREEDLLKLAQITLDNFVWE